MKIELRQPEEKLKIKAADMPAGSVGITAESANKRIVVRTMGNGPRYLVIWPEAHPIGIDPNRNEAAVDAWDVYLEPKGTELVFKF